MTTKAGEKHLMGRWLESKLDHAGSAEGTNTMEGSMNYLFLEDNLHPDSLEKVTMPLDDQVTGGQMREVDWDALEDRVVRSSPEAFDGDAPEWWNGVDGMMI